MGETCLEIRGVTKRFGSLTAVDNVSLTIERGEFFSLLGPSGCGKTTLLRMIAGFETTTAGQILINGQDIAPLPPYKRPVNTVFQHYALFPHMNIFQNVAFGLERKGTPKPDIQRIVIDALEQVQLAGFEKRRPGQLSGGQKQRVALARALVMRPRTEFVAHFMGAPNILHGTIRKEQGRAMLNVPHGPTFEVESDREGEVKFVVRPEKLTLLSEPNGAIALPVKIADEIFQGTNTSWVVEHDGEKLIIVEQNIKAAEDEARFRRGDSVFVTWDPRHTIILED